MSANSRGNGERANSSQMTLEPADIKTMIAMGQNPDDNRAVMAFVREKKSLATAARQARG